ncbi:hypothetical protein [Shewanella waksmanii]|uniref:hypothetical protein n=1 Tax=Shewanella waksmanii TaxID=213783 RepID=UPI003734F1EA
MELAGLLVAGISALGTLVQAYYAAKSNDQPISKKAINKAVKRAGSPLKTGAKTVDAVIDQQLLLHLCKQVEQHNNQLVAVFRHPDLTEAEKQDQVEQARAQICQVLLEVKRFNQQVLPTKRLRDLWLSNGCP